MKVLRDNSQARRTVDLCASARSSARPEQGLVWAASSPHVHAMRCAPRPQATPFFPGRDALAAAPSTPTEKA